MAMLDGEEHPSLSQHPADRNAYTLGRVSSHNVAIACLPSGQIGNNSAATVAAQMRYSFGSIRFGLLVGIGGGVPSEDHDIRLGDVVVSIPDARYGGVVQYDFGKFVKEGRFMHTSSLNAPPTVILTAISRLRAEHGLDRGLLTQCLSDMDTPMLQQNFTYQGAEHDLLFEAEYDHVDIGTTCEHCDITRLVKRDPRYSQDPVVHYGTIASGNGVMKHGATRDRLRQEHGVLCFEMEAASLMNDFPCVVIRGICDYADSHKNKRWQEYAAVTAAAYAKKLLSAIPREQVANTPAISSKWTRSNPT
jgi:nucleoside phosphorylase